MFGSARDEKMFLLRQKKKGEENIPHHHHIDFCLFTPKKKRTGTIKKYKVALNIHRLNDGTKIFFDSLDKRMIAANISIKNFSFQENYIIFH